MNPKAIEVKRKHHYVWARYLKAWAAGNNVHYISKKGLPAIDSVKGLAQEHGFYKISSFEKADVEYIKSMSKLSPVELQSIHMGFLDDFIKVSSFLKSMQRLNTQNTKLLSDYLQYNVLEDIHSRIERAAWPIISELRNGKVEVLENQSNRSNFCLFVAQQLTRTKIVRDYSIAASTRGGLPEFMTAALKKNWWFISLMLGINLGKSLVESGKQRHFLIENPTDTPFITSERPVINIHACMQTIVPDEPPENLDLYYPLSPTHAYMVTDSEGYDSFRGEIDQDQVLLLNRYMAESANGIVYGSTRESILSARNYSPEEKI